jgi:hypothetical protein
VQYDVISDARWHDMAARQAKLDACLAAPRAGMVADVLRVL